MHNEYHNMVDHHHYEEALNKLFWYQEGDVVHNLPENFNISDFDVFHSALLISLIGWRELKTDFSRQIKIITSA